MRQYAWMNDKFYYDTYFKNAFTLDPRFGFRPILGSKYYNQFGTSVNQYDIKKRNNITGPGKYIY